jgi:hypothetical protein
VDQRKEDNNVNPNENIHAVVFNRGRMFLRKAELAKEMNCSQGKINKMIPGVQEQIRKGRYSPYAISGDLYSFAVFVDYNKYRKDLEDPIKSKYVPEFRPYEIADLAGYCQRMVDAG